MKENIKKIKKLLLLMFFIVITASAVNATESRTIAIGSPGRYIIDNSNMFIYPATIMQYPDIVLGELRGTFEDNYTVGANFSRRNSVFGLHLNTANSLYTPVGFDNVQLFRSVSLFYAIGLGAMDLGFRLDVAADLYTENEDDSPEVYERLIYGSPSVGLSSETFDLSVFAHIPQYVNRVDNVESRWDGFGVGSDFRLKFNTGSFNIIPAANVYYTPTKYIDAFQKAENRSIFMGEVNENVADARELFEELFDDGEITAPDTVVYMNNLIANSNNIDNLLRTRDVEEDYSITTGAIGAGFNYHASENNLVFFGLNLLDVRRARSTIEIFSLDSRNLEVTDSGDEIVINDLESTIIEEISTIIYVPRVYIGFESSVLSWLTLRSGANMAYRMNKSENIVDGYIIRETVSFTRPFGFSIGSGMNFGNFDVDFVHNRAIFFNGPHIISGTTNGLSSRISLVYKFK